MKTLADIKRRIQPGVILECIENTVRPTLNGTRWQVVKPQRNGFFGSIRWRGDRETRQKLDALR